LNAWVDFNDNGSWLDAGEQIFTNQPLSAGANRLLFAVPAGATITPQTFARFRFNQAGSLLPSGPATDGEVEDYVVAIEAPAIEVDAFPQTVAAIELDLGALLFGQQYVPLSGPTTVNVIFEGPNEGDAHDHDPVANGLDEVQTEIVSMNLTGVSPTLGNVVVRLNPAPGFESLGQIEEVVNDTPGTLDVPPFTATGTATAYFDMFVEIQLLSLPGSPVYHNEDPIRIETPITFKPPAPGEKFQLTGGSVGLYDEFGGPTGILVTNVCHIPDPEVDFGDAPDVAGGAATGNPYPTLLEHDGARHNILPGYQMGTSIDPEADGQPDGTALGDDTDGNNDEDGVVFTSLLLVGRTATIDVTASQPMLLNAFLDFGADGSFAQAGDQIFTNQPLVPGVNKLAFVVPTSVTPGLTTFARFRVNSTGGLSYDGFAADGEVEDYQVNISLPLPDRIGVFRLGQNFHLDTTGNGAWDSAAGGDTYSVFGIPSLSGLATGIAGDWDSDGDDDLGLFYENRFYLDTTQNGKWDKTSGGDTFFDFGINSIRSTATPVVGDWDGNGTDDLGLYNDGFFYLDTSGNGVWDGTGGGDTFRDFGINSIRATAEPVVGDWDGDNADDLGLHNDGFFYLDTTGNGVWDTTAGGDTFHDFGISTTIRSTALPIVGDWNADGTDDLGLFNDPLNFYLDTTRNGTWDGVAGGDTYQTYDPGFDAFPLVGNWDLPGGVLLQASGGPADPSSSLPVLTTSQLDPLVEQAIAAWQAAGLDEDQLQTLSNTQFVIADLPDAALGQAAGTTITVDTDAAGYGWFVSQGLKAESGEPETIATDRMDLLTVVMHEIGHVLGYDHDDHGVMQDQLSTGIRRAWDELGDSWDDDFDFGG
jgi:hypothetical protein